MSAEEFVQLTTPLWRWILDNGDQWSEYQTAEVVAAVRVLFVACGGRTTWEMR